MHTDIQASWHVHTDMHMLTRTHAAGPPPPERLWALPATGEPRVSPGARSSLARAGEREKEEIEDDCQSRRRGHSNRSMTKSLRERRTWKCTSHARIPVSSPSDTLAQSLYFLQPRSPSSHTTFSARSTLRVSSTGVYSCVRLCLLCNRSPTLITKHYFY